MAKYITAHLELRSWVGTSAIGVSHYYGELSIPKEGERYDCERIEITRPLTTSEARRLNKESRAEGYRGSTYKAGYESGRFWDEESVQKAAVELLKAKYPKVQVLLQGNRAVCDPQPVVFGPEQLKIDGNALVAEAKANDWWEGDEDRMSDISQRWKVLIGGEWT